MKTAEQVKRYDLDTEVDGARMVDNELGDYVSYDDHIAALSAAEERERVLREALEKQNKFMSCEEGADEYPTDGCKCKACAIQRLVDAALATPAPAQPAQPKEHAQ